MGRGNETKIERPWSEVRQGGIDGLRRGERITDERERMSWGRMRERVGE